MKKFVVRCDLEGASGIVSYVQAEPWQAEYQDGRRYFMSDLLALLKGLDDGGADVIQVYDEHCYGRNILLDQIPDTYRADISFFCGKPDYTQSWAGGLDRETTGLILLGFHSKAGTHASEREALLHHSYDKNISDIRINGRSVGEIGMEAAIAGCFQVPLLLFTGDSAGAEEAQSTLPEQNATGSTAPDSTRWQSGLVLSDVGGKAADMVRVLMGNEHSRELVGGEPRLPEGLADPAAGDAHVDEQVGIAPGEECGVAGRAAGEGLKTGHECLPVTK